MKQNKNYVNMDKEYFKFSMEDTDIYFLYKENIYKSIKYNEEKHIVLNVDTMALYSISWGLYWTLKHFRTLDETRNNKILYKNVFQTNQLKTNYGENDIYNYDFKEQPRQIIFNKTNMKHYKPLCISGQTQYITSC
jgi:hypothetical protein